MSNVFVSYARANAAEAQSVADALRTAGFSVWRDDELPAHRAYAEVIEERLKAARAVVAVWSADAIKSQWVRAEADAAREAGKLVQLSIDGASPPIPFNQIQCAKLSGWRGDPQAPGWRKVVASVAELVGAAPNERSPGAPPAAEPPPLPSKPSIAVMPFANLSSDPEQDYFADGMMEEIVTTLARSRQLFVIASGSTLSFKGRAVGAEEVARQLGVRYVLEGSVRKAGERVRIAVKLIDAADGAQIWADRFDGSLEDVFTLQDNVAVSVAGIIEPAVREAEIRRASRRPTDNMGGYDLYLRATPLFRTFRKTEMLEALELMDRAIALDANFAMAQAVAATGHMHIITFGWSDDPERHRRRGLELAERALASGGDDPQVLAQAAVALARGLDPTPDRAAAVVDRAAALNPGSAYVWFFSGMIRVTMGDPDTAVVQLERARRLDPLSFTAGAAGAWMAVARFEQGRFDEALAQIAETTYRNPVRYAVEAALLGHLGRAAEAQGALALYRTLSTRPIEELASAWFHRAEHRRLLLDGIALARTRNVAG
jgi:adenylate cyclase